MANPDTAKYDGHVYKYNIPRGASAWTWGEEWNKRSSRVADIVKNFSWKDDDVVVLSFPRSGNHMIWTICRMLVQGNSATPPDPMEEANLFIFPYRENQTGRRVLNTHMIPVELPEGALERNSKRRFIVVRRNAKDCCVSCYTLMKTWTAMGEPGEWGPFGNWWLNARACEEFIDKSPDAPMLMVTYEDVVKKPVAMIKKIGDFIGVNPTEGLCKEIAAAVHIDTLRETVLITRTFDDFWVDLAKKEIHQYRKGKVGDWKNWFTVAQSESFHKALAKHMDGSKLRFDYE